MSIDLEAGLDRTIAELRLASECLAERVCGDATPEELEAAWAERVSLFAQLRELLAAGAVPSAAGRAQLRCVCELDASLIARARDDADASREALRDLARRRATIQAHGRRERVEPRALTVKV